MVKLPLWLHYAITVSTAQISHALISPVQGNHCVDKLNFHSCTVYPIVLLPLTVFGLQVIFHHHFDGTWAGAAPPKFASYMLSKPKASIIQTCNGYLALDFFGGVVVIRIPV